MFHQILETISIPHFVLAIGVRCFGKEVTTFDLRRAICFWDSEQTRILTAITQDRDPFFGQV